MNGHLVPPYLPLRSPMPDHSTAPEGNPSRSRSSIARPVGAPRPNNCVYSGHMLGETRTKHSYWPHLPVGLRGYLQPCRYVWNSDQLLELYTKIMFRGRVPSRARSRLGLFVGFPRTLLLCGRLVHPHGLRWTCCSRSDRTDETTFLCHSIVHNDVHQSPTPDLNECLRVEP